MIKSVYMNMLFSTNSGHNLPPIKPKPSIILFNFGIIFILGLFCFSSLKGEAPEWIVTKLDNPAPGYIKFDWTSQPLFCLWDNYGLKQYPDTVNVKSYSMDFKLLSNGNWAYQSEKYLYILRQDMSQLDSIPFIPDATIDPHEFQMLSNGHYLLLYQEEISMNLASTIAGGKSNAIVICNFLIETDRTGTIYWRWDAKDHVELSDVTSDIDITDNVIDFMHINSFAEDSDGNIIVSMRNLDEIAKINKTNGQFIWRMGGSECKNNQFTFLNDTEKGFTGFSHQHTVNILANGNFLIYDNGNMRNPAYSRAVEYEVNQLAKTIHKVWEYRYSPDIYTEVMGSVQRLPNGNTLINWGNNQITEVRNDKSIAFEMIANPENTNNHSLVYRAYRYVTRMNAVARKIDKSGTFDFNETNTQTGINVELKSMQGSSEASVEKHYYRPPLSVFIDAGFSSVFPYRWVFSHYGITLPKGIIKIKASTISNLPNPAKTTIYKRNKENSGLFEPLATSYNPATGYISADFNDLGEFVLCSNVLNIPAQASPIDKSELSNINGEFVWSSVPGAIKYQVQLSGKSDFSSTVINKYVDKELGLLYESLAYNTKYYWRVKALNSKDTSQWSPVWSFTTKQVPQVQLQSPVNNFTNFTYVDSLKWIKIPGIINYRIQISKSDKFDVLALDSSKLTKENFYFSKLQSGTKYYWRVLAYQVANQGPWSDYRSFITKSGIPLQTYPPADSTNLPRKGYVAWSQLAGYQEYIVQISDKPDFTFLIVNTLAKTTRYDYSLIGGKWYYWRVKAIKGTDTTDWSATSRFSAVYRAPDLHSPANYSMETKDAVIFEWATIAGNANYRLQISTDDNFKSIHIDTSGIIQNQCLIKLPADRTFYWRISGSVNNLMSEWSVSRVLYTGNVNILMSPDISIPVYNNYYNVEGIIKWGKVEGAVSYRLQISKAIDFSSILNDELINSDDYYEYNGLKYNSTYYVRLKAFSHSDSSVWSQPARLRTYWNFVNLIKPVDEELLVPVEGIFSWSKPIKADFYEVLVSLSPDFVDTAMYVTSISDTFYIYSGLQKNTHYYWKVRNIAGTDTCIWSFSKEFYTESDQVLATPTLLSPEYYQSRVPTEVTLEWKPVPDAQDYKVILSRSSNFDLLNYERDSIIATNTSFSGLRNNRYYYWKILAFNSSSMSLWSDTGVFLTEYKQPTVVSPKDNSLNQPVEGNLTWTKSADSVNYNIIISTDLNFKNVIIDKNTYSDTTLKYSLNPNTTYFWKVSSWTDENGSRWSNTSRFTTTQSMDVSENHIGTKISLSPQPASDFINIDGEFKSETDYTIFSVGGLEVISGIITDNRIKINGLIPGVYYIRIKDKTIKFIKL